jgi:hypothetical protein
VSHEKKLINFSLGLLVLGISQDACAAQPKWRHRTLAERRHELARSLEDREPNRPYSDRELELKRRERNDCLLWTGAYGLGAGAFAAARKPKRAYSLGVQCAIQAKGAYNAHCDLCEMEKHNDLIAQD